MRIKPASHSSKYQVSGVRCQVQYLIEAKIILKYLMKIYNAVSIEYGKHRAEILCQGCHGEDLSGVNNWFDGGPLGTIDSANLTFGAGGIGVDFTTEDYVRAIRHGIDQEGKPIFMVAVPSTAHLSDEDLGAIIAYVKTVPPVDHKTKGQNFTPLAKTMAGAGLLGDLPVEVVSHDVHVTSPERGVSVEYGEYIVNTNDCRVCHGPNLNGGASPDPTVTWISPNLTPAANSAFGRKNSSSARCERVSRRADIN
jgi:mono/diheme cytochrome c family protein